jgi:hypothetical protein
MPVLLFFLVFSLGILSMGLQLVASRALAPFFGNSILVWAAFITTFLAAFSILDAFRGGFVPPHLRTVEFYKLALSHLVTDGVFIANVRTDTALFASDLRTMRAVFPQVGFLDVPQPENAVMVGVNWASSSLQSRVEGSSRLSFNPCSGATLTLSQPNYFTRLQVNPIKKQPS